MADALTAKIREMAEAARRAARREAEVAEARAAVAKAIATGEPQEVRSDGKLAVVISAPRDRRPTEEELLARIATLEAGQDEAREVAAEWRAVVRIMEEKQGAKSYLTDEEKRFPWEPTKEDI